MFKLIFSMFFIVTINSFSFYLIPSSESVWADLSGLATINIAVLTAFIVTFGLSQLKATRSQLNVANDQLREAKKDNVRSFSHNAYSKYLKLTLEYPNFAHPEQELIKHDSTMHSQYRWFISNMLFYFEEILMINDKDKDWNKAISRQIKIHMWQISGSSYKQQGWSPELLKIINSLSTSRYYKKKRSNNDDKELLEVENLYQQYLLLLLKYPTYYKEDKSTEEIVLNHSEYFIFLKNAFYLLGYMMELSADDKEWTALIKEEKHKLETTYNSLNKIKFIDNELILKKHKKLLTI